MKRSLLSIGLALAFSALLALPTAGTAQQFDAGAAGPFRGFDDTFFGFDQSRFYRFASVPGEFRPWHQDRRPRFYLINRVLDIDQIRTDIFAVDILSNTRSGAVIVGR